MTKQQTRSEVITAKPKLAGGREQTIDVLIRVVPPESEKSAFRPKLNLGIVLDRSGSMQGSKMTEAREAAKYCIDQLLPTDRMSTVIFDDVVDVLIPGQLIEDKRRLKERIDTIFARNSTALHEAWVRGGLEVSNALDGNAVNRVLLITDGQANVGETNVDTIVTQAGQLAGKGVSTTTIGIGEDFNEDLLMPMANAGGGNAWHVAHADDMARIFAVELNGLLAQMGHSCTLSVRTADGVVVTDVLNDFERDEMGRYKLPNLEFGAPLDIVVRLRVPARAPGETAELAQFGLAYIDQESQMPAALSADLRLAVDSEASVSMLPENMDVANAVQMLMNARAREEAIRLMDSRNYAAAQQHLAHTTAASQVLFSVAPSAALSREIQDLQSLTEGLLDRDNDRMARKQMAYGSASMKRGK